MPAFGPSATLAALRGSPSVAAAVTVLHEVPAPIARLVATVTASSPQNVTLGLSNGVTIVWGSTARADGQDHRALRADARTARATTMSARQEPR